MALINPSAIIGDAVEYIRMLPLQIVLGALLLLALVGYLLVYGILLYTAPRPRPSRKSEQSYRTVAANGTISEPTSLPCWYEDWVKHKTKEAHGTKFQIDAPEVFISVVVPAYNEEERLPVMLEEAVEYLEQKHGSSKTQQHGANGTAARRRVGNGQAKGWEILIVSDGSVDSTAETALEFAKEHNIQPGSIRVVQLEENRGKGGAVTHGMRHVRGQYVIFADADGATKFADVETMVQRAEELQTTDGESRAVIVGSRAHLVGSEAVVKRSMLRNMLMYSFHVFIRLLTTPKTSRIADTQCGFKLFTRPALPYIVPYMHSEGWIFDVEMLMLTEMANIPMQEVPVGWKEVMGSKLNVIWDSIGMAWGLAVVRGAWSMGIWKKS